MILGKNILPLRIYSLPQTYTYTYYLPTDEYGFQNMILKQNAPRLTAIKTTGGKTVVGFTEWSRPPGLMCSGQVGVHSITQKAA